MAVSTVDDGLWIYIRLGEYLVNDAWNCLPMDFKCIGSVILAGPKPGESQRGLGPSVVW